MKADLSLDDGCARFLALNEAAFAAAQYEAAYHGLVGALHCAEQGHDPDRLGQISRLFREQLEVIDRTDPAHRLSIASARTAGHRSVFETGASTADAAAPRLRSEQRLAERPQGRWSRPPALRRTSVHRPHRTSPLAITTERLAVPGGPSGSTAASATAGSWTACWRKSQRRWRPPRGGACAW